MNSLRYLVSSVDTENNESDPRGGPRDSSSPTRKRSPSPSKKSTRAHRDGYAVSSTLELPDAPASLLWQLIVLILPFLAPKPAPKKQAKQKRRHRSSMSAALPPIPRLFVRSERKVLVLDLDETLIHSMTRGHHRHSQLVEVHLQNSSVASFYYVSKRPHCIDFLHAVLQWYDVAIFTAAVREYADPIIDLLERDLGYRAFKRRFYRDDCIFADGPAGGYIKDLRVLGEDLKRVLIVDNSPISFALQRANGIPIEGWISDPSDRALMQLLPALFALRHTTDVRSILCLQDPTTLLPAVAAGSMA